MSQQVFRLGDVQPNPFRNIERYPINRDKVEKLKGSIGRTDFWDNLVARETPAGPQIAYGHHRLVALREMFGPEHEISLIVRDLDDGAMLHIMADENMQEWAASGEVIVETVRAVRDFLGSGAPRKRDGQHGPKSNGTAEIIAFLGWNEYKITEALAIINAEEAGDLQPEDTAGLALEQAAEMRRAVRQIKDTAVRTKAIQRVREEVTRPGRERLGTRGIRDVVHEVQAEAHDKRYERPVVPADVARRLFAEIEGYWRTAVAVDGRPVNRAELVRLIAENRNTEELTASVRPWADQLADALDDMAEEASRLANLLRARQAVAIGAH